MSTADPPADGSIVAVLNEAATGPPRAYRLHPLCFALFPLLSLYAANLDQVPYPDAIRPFVVALLFAVTLGALIFLTARNASRTALFLTACLFLIFSYGHVTDLFERLTHAGAPTTVGGTPMAPMSPQSHGVLFCLWCILLGATVQVVRRIPRDLLRQLTSILNFVGVLLVALPAYTIASATWEHQLLPSPRAALTDDPIQDRLAKGHFDPRLAPSASMPDIYYIILDAYGREDVLQHYYGYSNRPFLDGLRQRGFYIANRARPNYGQTIESISSSLNMTYLDNVAAQLGKRAVTYNPLVSMIDHNAVMGTLRPHGYEYIAVTTGFDLTVPVDADMILGTEHVDKQRALTPFDVLALDTTPFAHIPETEQTLYDAHRDQLIQGFYDLGELPRLPFRKFVFAHILAPHPPFVFGPHGEPVRPAHRAYSIADGSDFMRRGTRPEYQAAYIAQLQHINTLVLQTIDAIYASSKVRPIIIVQGDHGPRMFVDWDSLERTDVRETYGNLNALELPDGSAPTVFYNDLTPANTFRLLLDHYFDAKLPAPPRSQLLRNFGYPIRLHRCHGECSGELDVAFTDASCASNASFFPKPPA